MFKFVKRRLIQMDVNTHQNTHHKLTKTTEKYFLVIFFLENISPSCWAEPVVPLFVDFRRHLNWVSQSCVDL